MVASELIEGMTCFQVLYAGPSMTRPTVVTYEFSGTGTLRDSGDPVYIFKYIPAFTYPDDEERTASDALPVMLAQEQLDMLSIDELIAELQEVAVRISRVAP